MKKIFSPSLLVVLFIVCAAAAPCFGEEPIVTTLDNGMTVALLENRQSPAVALRIYVKTGSLYEGEHLGAGVSHFLEHLVSGGSTSKRTEAESQQLLDSIGAQANAYTTRDHTCYHMTTASRFFDTALDLLTDQVTNAAIKQEEWDREFKVVQREMESRRSDPRSALQELMDATMFSIFPARHPVIGYGQVFRGLTRDDVYKYYRRTYVPDNMLLVAAGDLDPQKALEKIKTALAGFERRPVPDPTLPPEPAQLARRDAAREMPASQAYLLVAWRTIPLYHPDLYPLDLLSFILGAGEGSRLVRVLREEKHLVTSIAAWSDTPGYDGGEFGVAATLNPEKLAAAQEAILAEVARLRERLVSPEELTRAKRQKVAEHVFGLQTVEAQAANVGLDILIAHDANFSRQYVRRIQRTTAEEIRDTARKYLSDEKLCVAVVRPRPKGPAEAPTEAAGQPPGEIQKVTLSNGLRLLVKRNPTPSLVAIQAFFLGGLRAEAPEKSGLSLFTARMLARGAGRRSAEEIALAFDSMGGSLAGSSGNNSMYLSANCLSEDFPKTMEIFADVLRDPAFKADEMERLRPLLIAAAKRQQDNWREELATYFRKNFFKAHPYRNTPIGAPETLAAIRREDLVEFYRKGYAPEAAVLAVFGDVNPAEVKAAVERRLGSWKGGAAALPALPPEPPPAEDRTLQEKGHEKMGGVFIGYPGMTLKDEKDRYAMDVLDALISGIELPRGWLHETLRGKGLVYEVHAYSFVGIEPGYFGIYAGCEPARVEEVKKNILEQIARLFREKPSEGELEAARRVCITAEVLDRQTDAQQAMQAALDELYGLGYDYPAKYAPGILAVSADDVQRVAKKYLTHYLCVLMTP